MGHPDLSRLALRRRLIAAAAALATAAFAAHGVAARTLEDVRRTGVLRVAVYLDYKPFSFRKDGQAAGIDVDLAKALADKLGVRLDLFELRADDDVNDDLRNGVWKGTVFGAAPGDVMLHIPFDKRIEAGNDRVALFAPYHVDGLAMVTDPEKTQAAADLSLLEKDRISVAIGTLGDWLLVSARDHAYLPHVVHERSLERAAEDFERAETAGFFGEESAAESFARGGKRPYAIVHPRTGQNANWTLGVAVKSDARDLGQAVASTVEELAANGGLQRIFAEHGVDWRKPEAER